MKGSLLHINRDSKSDPKSKVTTGDNEVKSDQSSKPVKVSDVSLDIIEESQEEMFTSPIKKVHFNSYSSEQPVVNENSEEKTK